MDAPKCKICGDRHWGPCAATTRNRPPTAPRPSLGARTQVSPNDIGRILFDSVRDIMDLKAEVASLKAQIASSRCDAIPSRVTASAHAERQRRYRERRAAERAARQ